jgi:hypothetical protein
MLYLCIFDVYFKMGCPRLCIKMKHTAAFIELKRIQFYTRSWVCFVETQTNMLGIL